MKLTHIFSGFVLVLFAITLYFDPQIVQFINANRIGFLNDYMYFVTDAGLFVILSIIATWLITARRYKELLLIAGASLLSLETGYILKKLFQIPRPDAIATQLTYATGYTFPSIHSAIVFSIIPFCQRIFKTRLATWPAILLLFSIAISRTYLGVHYLSDILFGGLLGYLIAHVTISLESRYQIAERFIYNIVNHREVRRQTAHLVTGLLIILLVKLHVLEVHMLGGILVVGGILSIVSRYKEVPYLYPVLVAFERPKELKRFPGKGSFFLVLGSYLSLLLFPENIALAAIAIMAVGDSLTTLIGIYYGQIKNPLNRLKHLEGTFLAIIACTIVAFNFVNFEKAFLGSIIAMIFETLTIRHIDQILDDNLLIPLIAGAVMMFVI